MGNQWLKILGNANAWLSRKPIEELLPLGDAIFLHRPHGQPCHGITSEVIRDFNSLSRLILTNQDTRRYTVPADVTLITYNSRPSKSRIERCYEAVGITDFVVLGKEVAQWSWSAKVRLVLNYLEAGNCTTRYLLATDADDVLMVNDPATLLDRFHSYSCDVLFCNTFVDWPPNKKYRDFETLQYYRYPFHCRLSAGGYIGKQEAIAAYLRMLLKACEDREEWAFFNGGFDDQLGWRSLHCKFYPSIQVDTACRIFKRYDIFKDCVD